MNTRSQIENLMHPTKQLERACQIGLVCTECLEHAGQGPCLLAGLKLHTELTHFLGTTMQLWTQCSADAYAALGPSAERWLLGKLLHKLIPSLCVHLLLIKAT